MTESMQQSIRYAIRMALESSIDPAFAAADWLARDIDPRYATAAEMLCHTQITLEDVHRAKSVYKTMRILGETAADRRIAARLYVGAIAAGLVHHQTCVTRQSKGAMRRGLQGLADDTQMPKVLRELAASSLDLLESAADS